MLSRLLLWTITALGLARKPDLIAELASINPTHEAVQPGKMILVGGPGYRKWAYFRCPCGCGELIMLALTRSRWTATWDWFRRPSIYPSVRQTSGCHSHFWIRRGLVEWCSDTGERY
jgi:Family of unknown function (DUF6527)